MVDTVNSGVHLVGDGIQSGVGTVSHGVHLGGGGMAHTLESGAHLAVGTAMGTSHILQAGVTGVGPTIAGASVESRVSQRHFGNQNEMQIFCSDLYTADFIKEEIIRAKQNILVTNMLFEDLIVRDEEAIIKAARKFIRATSVAPPEPDSDDDTDDESNFMPRGYERNWVCVRFCDTISTEEEYIIYMNKKRIFQAALKKTLKKKGITKLPIKFESKIEIHPYTDMNDFVDLLNKVEEDKTILSCKFAGDHIVQDKRRLRKVVADYFDQDTLEMKDGREPLETHIRYSCKPVSKGKRPTLLVRQCSAKLEFMALHSSKANFDFTMSDGEVSCPDLSREFKL